MVSYDQAACRTEHLQRKQRRTELSEMLALLKCNSARRTPFHICVSLLSAAVRSDDLLGVGDHVPWNRQYDDVSHRK